VKILKLILLIIMVVFVVIFIIGTLLPNPRISHNTFSINAPIESVWDKVTNYADQASWRSGIKIELNPDTQTKRGELGELGELSELSELGELNELGKLSELGKLNELSELGEWNELSELGEWREVPINGISITFKETERIKNQKYRIDIVPANGFKGYSVISFKSNGEKITELEFREVSDISNPFQRVLSYLFYRPESVMKKYEEELKSSFLDLTP